MMKNAFKSIIATTLLAACTVASAGPAGVVDRMFMQPGGVARTFQDKAAESVTVKDFGAVGDCVKDDTAAIQAALAAADNVRIPKPKVCYLVSSITVGANKTIQTDGISTIIKQVPGSPVGTRLIVVTGSNVRIGSIKVYGNIVSDTDEQQHAVFIKATATTGNIENVTLGDIVGQDIRGDVLYVGQATGYSIKNVSAGNISGDNIYRNVVSFVSGTGLTINSITGTRIGFKHLDVEPDVGSGPAVGLRVGRIKGRLVGINGPTSSDYVDGVNIDLMDLDPAYAAQSSPSYAFGVATNDGLTLRNVKAARIGQFFANGFNRSALFTITNSGELGAEKVIIGYARVTNCAQTDTTYSACFNLPNTYLVLESLYADVSGTRYVVNNATGGRIANATVNVGTGASFIKSSTGMTLADIKQTGTGIFINSGGGNRVVGANFTGTRLSSFSTPNLFDDVTATASEMLWDSSNDRHVVRNSTLNGVYYPTGMTKSGYQDALHMGVYYLWIETATGKLRIKSGAPTSDSDGTVVGAQS